VLKGNYTRAADIFSLGMTILELATDLDVPRGGDAWHQLRTGKLPEDIKHNLSQELVSIIIRMIDPDPQTRPTAEQLLQMDIVKKFKRKRKANIVQKNLTSLFTYIWGLICAFCGFMWYFGLIYPLKKFLNFSHLNGSESNNTVLHQTSTPNRDILHQNDLHGSLVNIADEYDYEDEDDG
jgi:serine/threonine protein kinase